MLFFYEYMQRMPMLVSKPKKIVDRLQLNIMQIMDMYSSTIQFLNPLLER